jgi:hypothetical protein
MARNANFRKTQQPTGKEAEKPKFSLPMRGRRLFINEKANDAQMRTEMLRYANMNEEVNMATDNQRWMDTVRQLEDNMKRTTKARSSQDLFRPARPTAAQVMSEHVTVKPTAFEFKKGGNDDLDEEEQSV